MHMTCIMWDDGKSLQTAGDPKAAADWGGYGPDANS